MNTNIVQQYETILFFHPVYILKRNINIKANLETRILLFDIFHQIDNNNKIGRIFT